MPSNQPRYPQFNHVMLIAFLVLTLLLPQTNASAAPIPIPSKDASWLETLNYYRLSSGVDAVTENPAQSAAALKHSIYLAKSDPKYFTGQYLNPHSENPASPYYTLEGSRSGTNLTSLGRESEAIDSWMQAPLHAIGLLRNDLKTTGYASVFNERTGWYETGLDIINGLIGSSKKIITFPGDGSSTRLYKFTGETPDPRESCGKDWKEFRGLPIFASFPSSPPQDITGKIVTPSLTTLLPGPDLCIISEHSWISTDPVISYGIEIMKGDHIVIAIPKLPLTAGQYSVTLSGSGMVSLNWKFSVVLPPPVVKFSSDVSQEKISWDSVVGQEADPIKGYTVISRNALNNERKEYGTKDNSLSTGDWPQGKYWVCVIARSQSAESECPLFWSYTIDRKPGVIATNFDSVNPKVITWRVNESIAPSAKITSLIIQIRQAGTDKNQVSQFLPIDAREFRLLSLSPGDYEVCVQALNSYGISTCDWDYFEVIKKILQEFSSVASNIDVGDFAFLRKLNTSEISLLNLSPSICDVQEYGSGIEISGIKPGLCNFQISADEDSFLLAYQKSYSIKISEVIKKIPQEFSSLASTTSVGKSVYLRKLNTSEISLLNLSPSICDVQEHGSGIEISGIKPGLCNFQISADEDSFLLAYQKSYSIKITKEVLTSEKKFSTIKCIKGKIIKYASGVNPTCPRGYKKSA